jgi:hypothetical protein
MTAAALGPARFPCVGRGLILLACVPTHLVCVFGFFLGRGGLPKSSSSFTYTPPPTHTHTKSCVFLKKQKKHSYDSHKKTVTSLFSPHNATFEPYIRCLLLVRLAFFENNKTWREEKSAQGIFKSSKFRGATLKEKGR